MTFQAELFNILWFCDYPQGILKQRNPCNRSKPTSLDKFISDIEGIWLNAKSDVPCYVIKTCFIDVSLWPFTDIDCIEGHLLNVTTLEKWIALYLFIHAKGKIIKKYPIGRTIILLIEFNSFLLTLNVDSMWKHKRCCFFLFNSFIKNSYSIVYGSMLRTRLIRVQMCLNVEYELKWAYPTQFVLSKDKTTTPLRRERK